MQDRYKIILVDSHEIVRCGVCSLLSAEPSLEVVGQLSNCDQLVEQCIALRPNLVILEFNTPDVSPIELIKKIKKIDSVDVLIYSSLLDNVYAVRALKSGACGFVGKNNPTSELVKAIYMSKKKLKYLSPETSQYLVDCLLSGEQQPLHLSLSDREFETFQFIAAGKKTAEIAKIMNISVKTVSMYRQRALLKTGLRNNSELISFAIRNDLTIECYSKLCK